MGFEPTISAGERPQTYALDRAATGTGTVFVSRAIKLKRCVPEYIQSADFFFRHIQFIVKNSFEA